MTVKGKPKFVNTFFSILCPLCSQTIGEQLKLHLKRNSMFFVDCWGLKFATCCVPRGYNLSEWEFFRTCSPHSHPCILHYLNHICLSGKTSHQSHWIINTLHNFLKHTAMWFVHSRAKQVLNQCQALCFLLSCDSAIGLFSLKIFLYFEE